jgi:hypothetical protein
MAAAKARLKQRQEEGKNAYKENGKENIWTFET